MGIPFCSSLSLKIHRFIVNFGTGVEKLKLDAFFEKKDLPSPEALSMAHKLFVLPCIAKAGTAEKSGGDKTIEIQRASKNERFSPKTFGTYRVSNPDVCRTDLFVLPFRPPGPSNVPITLRWEFRIFVEFRRFRVLKTNIFKKSL